MNVLMFVYFFILFFVLTPGILVVLPKKGSKMVVASTHALIFALLATLTYKIVCKFATGISEGFNGCKENEHYSLELKQCIPNCKKDEEHYNEITKACVKNECPKGQYIPNNETVCTNVPNCESGKYFSQRYKECRDNLIPSQ